MLSDSLIRRLFSGGKFTEVLARKADRPRFFSTQTLSELKFFIGQKWDKELVGQAGGQTILHV